MTSARTYFATFAATAVAMLLIFVALVANAQENTIVFPVTELGNCASKEECHAYCDNLVHVNECVSFAQSHGLMSTEEAKVAREFVRLGGKGPGGCTSKDFCEEYCEDPTHMRQCLTFARQSGLMDEEDLAEAEKVVAYIEAGGTMPGGCRGENECRAYCESSEHAEECMKFALKAGFMSEQEVEIFKKTGGKGPGNCAGRQCQAYCEDESHREQCVAFALEHGLMSEEERQQMEEGREKAKEALLSAPPAVLSCIEVAIGAEKTERLKHGEGFAGPELGQVLPRCFREVMGDGSSGPFGPGSEASDCMRKVFGEDFEEQMRNGELDPGARDDEIRECMQAQRGEGFLNDEGQWERPERGEPPEGGFSPMLPRGEGERTRDSSEYEEGLRQQHEGERDALRRETEERTRFEIESQMRSGNFDPNQLPPDFRPEGLLPPPESFNRQPEGVPMEGVQPLPEQFEQFQMMDQMMEGGREPTSMAPFLLANIFSAIQYFFGMR